MNRRNEIVQHAIRMIDVPQELITGMPLLEIYGNQRVLIENHHGVKEYTCYQISVCSNLGTYSINGNQLEIASMTKHKLVIRGTIESVVLKCGR